MLNAGVQMTYTIPSMHSFLANAANTIPSPIKEEFLSLSSASLKSLRIATNCLCMNLKINKNK